MKVEILREGWIGEAGNGRYHGWPTLMRCRDGKLLVTCSGQRLAHVCPRGRVLGYESCDNGVTWSQPRLITSGPLDDRDAGLLETPAGTLLVNWFTSLAFVDCGPTGQGLTVTEQPRDAAWAEAEENITLADIRKGHGFFMKRSTDGGKTWSEKYRVPLNNVHGPCVLQDGTLLWVGREVDSNSILKASRFGKRCIACRSTDDGVTWEEIGELQPADGHVTERYHELHQVQADDGTIICHIRNQNFKGEDCGPTTWQCHSTDGGITWSKPEFIFEGFPSFLCRLRDGRLMASYGMRNPPFGNQVRISEDCGRSWSCPITISDDAVSNDLGYTSTVEMDDGTFMSLWYEHPASAEAEAKLRYAVWKL